MMKLVKTSASPTLRPSEVEPLLLEVKDRASISSNTTLPYNEPDYEAALTFTLSEATRLTGQLRREQLQLRELSLTIRVDDFSEVGGSRRFTHPQFLNSIINAALEEIFRDLMGAAFKPVRQIRIAFWNLRRLDTQPTLWGKTEAERCAYSVARIDIADINPANRLIDILGYLINVIRAGKEDRWIAYF